MPADVKKLGIAPPGKPEVEETAIPVGENVESKGLLGPVADSEAPQVDESVVKNLLKTLGTGTHQLAGDEDVPNHWKFSDDEIETLAPALTRIINRRPAVRRAVMRGDEMTVAVILAGYLGRNTADGKKAKEKRSENESREIERTQAGMGTADSAVREGQRSDGSGRGGVRATPTQGQAR